MLGAFSDTRLEARLLGAVLSFELAKGMFGGGLWILSPHSVTGKVALLSAYPSLIAYTWMALSIMVTPYFLMQLFGWGERHRAVLTRLACRANLASGVIWTYLAYLSKNLDYQNITTIFIANGVACIAMAAVLANGINSAQMRAKGGDQ